MAGKMREPSKTAAKGGRGGLLMATSASSPKQRRSTGWLTSHIEERQGECVCVCVCYVRGVNCVLVFSVVTRSKDTHSHSLPHTHTIAAWQLPLVDVFKHFDAAGGTRCAKTGDVTKHTVRASLCDYLPKLPLRREVRDSNSTMQWHAPPHLPPPAPFSRP
jgi:hypothetical protein